MTMQEIAESLGVSYDTVNRCVKRILPGKLEHGKRACFDELEVAKIRRDIANNTDVQKQIGNGGKFMTIRNVADVLGVSYHSVYRAVGKLFPDKMKNGKETCLGEVEVTAVSRELKGDYHTSQPTFAPGVEVANITTRLEVIANYKAATEAMIAMLEAEKSQLRAENEAQKALIEEQKPKVEVYDRIAGSSGLKSLQETAAILGIGSNVLFATLRGMNVLYRSNGNNIPMRKYLERGYFEVKEEPYKRGGKDYLYSRTFVTEKGLLWLEKIVRQGA